MSSDPQKIRFAQAHNRAAAERRAAMSDEEIVREEEERELELAASRTKERERQQATAERLATAMLWLFGIVIVLWALAAIATVRSILRA
jgi:cell division septal protein FtsQ